MSDATATPAAAPAAPSGVAPASPPAPVAAPVQSVAVAPALQSPAAPAVTAPTASPSAPVADDAAKVRAQLHRVLIGSAVKDLARALGAHNPEDVLALTGQDFEVNEADQVVVRGDPRTTVKDHLAKVLAARQYMLKPALPQGAGASPQVSPPPGPPVHDLRTAEGATAFLRGATFQMFGVQPPAQATPSTGR